MPRALTLSALLAATLSVRGQDADIEVKKFSVRAAAAPAQALRYSLLPEVRDRLPGNAVTSYYRAFSPDWWSAIAGDKDFHAKTEKWLTTPLKDLTVGTQFRALEEVDRGARRQYCDWELTDR